MTLEQLTAMCKRLGIPADADVVMWDERAELFRPVATVVAAGPNPRDADATGGATVQLWPGAEP